jgi:hypothetical protein
LSPLAVTLAAGFSGSVAAAASHGFDTARSRSQCTVLLKVWPLLLFDKFFEILVSYGFLVLITLT